MSLEMFVRSFMLVAMYVSGRVIGARVKIGEDRIHGDGGGLL